MSNVPAKNSGVRTANNLPEISVALCTYNGEQFLEDQLESILSQTLLPGEIVISDDGSRDGTLEVVSRVLTPERLSKMGISLKIVRHSRTLGVAKNFEAALAACSGEFVSLCDQDDIWHPNRLAILRAEFSSDDVMLVHSDARLVDAAGHPLGASLFFSLGAGRRELLREQGPRGFFVLLRRNLVTGATAMIRSNLFRLAQPIPSSWVHDYWLATVATVFGRIVVAPGELIDYRQHESNQIGVTKLTPSIAVQLLGHSRRSRHEGRVQRLLDLSDRLADGGLPATDSQRAFVAAKLAHEQIRLGLPPSRRKRVGVIMREVVSGRYHRLSRGLRDVVRDVLSPP